MGKKEKLAEKPQPTVKLDMHTSVCNGRCSLGCGFKFWHGFRLGFGPGSVGIEWLLSDWLFDRHWCWWISSESFCDIGKKGLPLGQLWGHSSLSFFYIYSSGFWSQYTEKN